MTAGSIRIDLDWDGTAITGVAIRNSRPEAARLLLGRTPAEAVSLVPRLFGICRHGQAAAARLALAAAAGTEAALPRVAVAAEAAQEHLWRLLLDWPTLLGLEPAVAAFTDIHRRLAEAVNADDWGDAGAEIAEFCEREALGMPVEDWPAALARRDFGGALLGRLLAALEPERPAELPPLLPAGLSATEYFDGLPMTFDGHFAREPHWNWAPAETGPLAHWADLAAGSGLGPVGLRVWARAAELARAVAALAGCPESDGLGDGLAPEPGLGFAAVATARGILMHGVRLQAGRIAEYTIVAPTEWNFHPEGSLRLGLVGRVADTAERAEQAARRLALALDPCVPSEVAVRRVD